MADTKISALTALGAVPADDDVFAMADTSAAASRKVTFDNAFRQGWSMIQGAGMAGSITLSSGVAAIIDEYDTNYATERNATADQANGQITVNLDGQWTVHFDIGFSPLSDVEHIFYIYVNGATSGHRITYAHSSTAPTSSHAHITALLDLSAGDVVSAYAEIDDNDTFSITDTRLVVTCHGEAP